MLNPQGYAQLCGLDETTKLFVASCAAAYGPGWLQFYVHGSLFCQEHLCIGRTQLKTATKPELMELLP